VLLFIHLIAAADDVCRLFMLIPPTRQENSFDAAFRLLSSQPPSESFLTVQYNASQMTK